jgi:hypothetical protein
MSHAWQALGDPLDRDAAHGERIVSICAPMIS